MQTATVRFAQARAAAWWPALVALVAVTLALGVALAVPYSFSDPNAVDPYVVRLSVTALAVAAAAFVLRRLRDTRGVLLAVAAITCTFTLFSAGPQALVDVFHAGAGDGDRQVFWASVAQVVATVPFLLALLLLPPALRARLRLTRFGWAAVVATVAGIALLLLVTLALPADLLGRDGIAPVAAIRDLPWLGPASLMQAWSQEVPFRGLLMGGLERVMRPGWANVAQAAFFGLTHLAVNYQGPVAPFVPVTFAVGLALGWVVQRTGSIWPAVLVHGIADIAITVAVLPGLYGF